MILRNIFENYKMNLNNPELNADWIKTFDQLKNLAVLAGDSELVFKIKNLQEQIKSGNMVS